MNWKTERDLLIAQTLAFVQSVTGKKPDAELSVAESNVPESNVIEPNVEAEPDIQAAPIDAIEQSIEIVEPPNTIQMPRMSIPSDVRTEMQARVANFRAHQERFHREREEYFSATLAKARAATENDSAPNPSQPVNR